MLPSGDQMHYTATGPEDGKTILFVHGYPTSAYLYRDVVAEVCGPSNSPYRVAVPTLERDASIRRFLPRVVPRRLVPAVGLAQPIRELR